MPNMEFIRESVQSYGGRIEELADSWFRIDVDRTNTRIEIMTDGKKYLVKAVGQMGTIAELLALLAAGE